MLKSTASNSAAISAASRTAAVTDSHWEAVTSEKLYAIIRIVAHRRPPKPFYAKARVR